MSVYDEKDYIMRIIKEMVRVLISLILGRQYTSVELQEEDKYEVSGKKLRDFLAMVDKGEINKAENVILSKLDYSNKDNIIAAALFYQYLSKKEESFLLENNYSGEEVLDGLRLLIKESGYGDLMDILD